MDTLLKADIFFFVTALAVVVIAAILAVVLVYLIRILRDVKSVSGRVKEQAELVSEDISDLRHKIRQKNWSWLDLCSSLLGGWRRKKGRRSNRE